MTGVILMAYKPSIVIPRSSMVRAIVFTDDFWKKAVKLGIVERVLDKVSDIVQDISEENTSGYVGGLKISRADSVYRVRVGRYRLFYKLDHRRHWIVFFDIKKRDKHTYRCGK